MRIVAVQEIWAGLHAEERPGYLLDAGQSGWAVILSSGLNDKTDLWEEHSGQEVQPANSFIRLTVVQMVERNTIGFA